MEEISIESAAPASVILEQPEPFLHPYDISLGESFPASATKRFHPPRQTATVRLYNLTDVELDTACCLLWKDARKISETKYLLLPEHDRQSRIMPERLIKLPSGTTYVLGYNNPRKNYYHWTIQVLPAIFTALRNVPDSGTTLVLREIAPWQEELLRLLGLDTIPRLTLDPHHHYAFPNLTCCDVLWGRSAFEVSRLVARRARPHADRGAAKHRTWRHPLRRPHGCEKSGRRQ